MGRASKLIKKLEDAMTALRERNGTLLQELGRTCRALSAREGALERLLELIDKAENQAGAGAVDPRVVREIGVIEGNLKALSRNLKTCKAALGPARDQAKAILDSVDPDEVNDLIKDKEEKEKAKGKASKGLKKLRGTWKELTGEIDTAKKRIRDALRQLNPSDIPDLPPLPQIVPPAYDV